MENIIIENKNTEAQKRAMKKYIEKVKGSEAYINSRKTTNQKYYQKRKEYYEKYKELLKTGLLQEVN